MEQLNDTGHFADTNNYMYCIRYPYTENHSLITNWVEWIIQALPREMCHRTRKSQWIERVVILANYIHTYLTLYKYSICAQPTPIVTLIRASNIQTSSIRRLLKPDSMTPMNQIRQIPVRFSHARFCVVAHECRVIAHLPLFTIGVRTIDVVFFVCHPRNW